jgi:hypothetical protein
MFRAVTSFFTAPSEIDVALALVVDVFFFLSSESLII